MIALLLKPDPDYPSLCLNLIYPFSPSIRTTDTK